MTNESYYINKFDIDQVGHSNGIEAQVLLGTKSPFKDFPSIWTLRLKFPRFILAQLSKHRKFSFNSQSTRAIKASKMISLMDDNVFIPRFGKAQKGMTGEQEHNQFLNGNYEHGNFSTDFEDTSPEQAWLTLRDTSISYSKAYEDAGYHQESFMRACEPYQFIEIILTATDFDNFFNLRIAPDAQSEIHILAQCMKDAMQGYTLKSTRKGWHLPMISDSEVATHSIEQLLKINAARSAVISYYNHRGEPMTYERCLGLYKHLVPDDGLPHLSTLEHAARGPNINEYIYLTSIQEEMLSRYCHSFWKGGEESLQKKVVQLEYFANMHGWITSRYDLEGTI